MKQNIKSLSSDDRPREKLLAKGRSALTDSELLAILIGSGNSEMNAVELSRFILSSVDNDLTKLSVLTVQDLIKFKGIGEAKSITIIAAMELGRRRKETTGKILKISSSQDAFNILYPSLSDLIQEEFWVVYLSKANRVLYKSQQSIGTSSQTLVDIKLIAKEAISYVSSAVIIAHNHPSGNLTPSTADKSLTERIIKALELFDIKVLDHLIIGNNQYYSFADEGLI